MKANYITCQPALATQTSYYRKCQEGILYITGIMKHASGFDPYNVNIKYWRNAILNIGGEPQHLYFTSDGDIKTDEWFLYSSHGDGEWVVVQAQNGINVHDGKTHRKIVATTDKRLGLLFISYKDVKHYLEHKEEISLIKLLTTEKGKICSLKKDNSVIVFKEKQSEYNRAIDDCIRVIENSGIYESDSYNIVFTLVKQIKNIKKK